MNLYSDQPRKSLCSVCWLCSVFVLKYDSIFALCHKQSFLDHKKTEKLVEKVEE